MKTRPYGPFLGINNRLPDYALHVTDKGDYLRRADNVIVNNAGRLRRRTAAQKIHSVAGLHSMFEASDGTRYAVRDSVLYAITLPTYAETSVATLTSNARMSYVEYAGFVWYSNGVDSGRAAGASSSPIGMPAPATPVVTAATGSLYPGRYKVVLSYANATTGEEGAASYAKSFVLEATGGMEIELPAAVDGATHVNVYVSFVNGDVAMRSKSVAVGAASTTVSLQSEIGAGKDASREAETLLPAGSLFLHNGQLCSRAGKFVHVGSPYRPGYCDAVSNYIPFPADVSNAISAQSGVFVVADKTYWLLGEDLLDVQLVREVLPYGGVPGTDFKSPNKSFVGWFGAKGIVIGTQDGEVQAVMSDNIDLVPPASGFSIVRTSGGINRVVSCGWCLNLDNLAATTFSDYEFTSVAGEYGTKADGVYTVDGVGNVVAGIGLGRVNFGTEELKRLPAVYFGTDAEYPLILNVDGRYDYPARSGSNERMQMQRVDPGKGLRASWFDLSITNTDGCDFELASVSFAPAPSNRRI